MFRLCVSADDHKNLRIRYWIGTNLHPLIEVNPMSISIYISIFYIQAHRRLIAVYLRCKCYLSFSRLLRSGGISMEERERCYSFILSWTPHETPIFDLLSASIYYKSQLTMWTHRLLAHSNTSLNRNCNEG
jgi:hypothetical protein